MQPDAPAVTTMQHAPDSTPIPTVAPEQPRRQSVGDALTTWGTLALLFGCGVVLVVGGYVLLCAAVGP